MGWKHLRKTWKQGDELRHLTGTDAMESENWNLEMLKGQKEGDDGREGRTSANSPVSGLDMELFFSITTH